MVETTIHKLGLVGHPVQHSLSPDIHDFFFKLSGLEGHYECFDLKPDELSDFCKQARHSMRGFNVTIPYKEKIIDVLDELSPQARRVKAVNTVVNKAGRLIGFNTDGPGFLQPLKNKIHQNQPVLVIGAGGAAKAVISALLTTSVPLILTWTWSYIDVSPTHIRYI